MLTAVAGLFHLLVGVGVVGANYVTSERLYVQHAPLQTAAAETDRTRRNEWRHYGYTPADAKLIALDTDTGRLCQDFREKGRMNLTDLMGKVPPGFHFIISQLLLVNDRVVLGGWIYDNQARTARV